MERVGEEALGLSIRRGAPAGTIEKLGMSWRILPSGGHDLQGTTVSLSQGMLAGVGSPLLLTNVGYLLKYRQTLQDLTSEEIRAKEEARMYPAHVKSKECQLW